MVGSLRVGVSVGMALLIGSPLAAAPAVAAPPVPDRVLVRVDDSGVRMTDTLRPGRHRFVVVAKGGEQDGLQLIRPRAGYTVEEYTRDLRAGSGSDRAARSATRRMEANLGLRGGVMVDRGRRAVFWQTVSRGRLWVVAQNSPREVHQVQVTGRPDRVSAPRPSATLTVTDGSVLVPPTALRTRGVFRFRNQGAVPHMIGLARLVDGRTAADATAYLDAIFGDDPSLDPATMEDPFDDEVYGAPTMSVHPGGSMLMKYSLPPGDYVAVCIVLDWTTKRLHAQRGELAAVRVG